jgi:TrbL/VirB6 plasmid conjugal transfer protein
MKQLIKISLIFFAILFFLNTNASSARALTFAEIVALMSNVNPDIITNFDEAVIFTQKCDRYPGLLNKIVQCVNGMVSGNKYFKKLRFFNRQFASITNAVLVLYIMFFGMKLSMNVVENVRGEMIIVLLTCFFITYVNNTMRMESFVKFFINLQNEFMNVATGSMYSVKKDGNAFFDVYGDIEPNDPKSQSLACFDSGFVTFKDKNNNNITKMNKTTIWARADCLIAYIMGAHPVLTRKGALLDSSSADMNLATELPSALTSNIPQVIKDMLGNINKQQIIPFPPGSKPFPNMHKDPFEYYRLGYIDMLLGFMPAADLATFLQSPSPNLSGLKSLSPAPSTIQILSVAARMKPGDHLYVFQARPINNELLSSTMSFSLIVIMVGLLFSDPQMGLMIFLTGAFIIVMIVTAFGQAMIVYFTSLFAILLLGLVAPLILPTFLFQSTRDIFRRWIHLLIAYSLQPGIVLCYLSFMVYVLQYVISYQGAISSLATNKTDESPATTKHSDFNFGTLYTEGYNGGVEVVKLSKEMRTSLTESYEKAQMEAANVQKNEYNNEAYNTSFMNRGTNVFDPLADQVATEDTNELLRKGFNLRGSGTDSKTLSLPGFEFFGGTFLGKSDINSGLSKLFFSADSTNPNLELSIQDLQNNKRPIGDLLGVNDPCITDDNLNGTTNATSIDVEAVAKCLVKRSQQQKFVFNSQYLQTLMIILITLAITMTFLSNVMDFSSKLVGMGDLPQMGKALNVYNLATNKMSRMLKGGAK